MNAVVRIAGKQVQVDKGLRVRVPKLNLEEGVQREFTDVLLVSTDDGQTVVGTPIIQGAAIKATVVGHGRGEKLILFKMKRRKTYRRRTGHRQDYTEIQIDDIVLAN